MKNKILVFAILIVITLPLILAQINLRQNQIEDVKFQCYFNGTFISS